jgi:hypothetical protein
MSIAFTIKAEGSILPVYAPSFRFVYRVLLIVVALMSGPFSLIREVLQFIDPVKYPEKPLFMACLWTAFMVAMFLIWLDEFQARKHAEKKLFDERPIVGLDVEGVEGPKAWEEHPIPITFTIKHLAGRLPTSIEFDPIPSKNGNFSLRFDALPHVERPPQRSAMRYEIFEIGAPQLNAHDMERTRPYQKKILGLFLDDSPMELVQLDYGLSVHFLDGIDRRSQQFVLRFDKQRWRFAIRPLSKL